MMVDSVLFIQNHLRKRLLTDSSDDDDMGDIDLDISAGSDPSYKPVWTTTPPQFGVDRLYWYPMSKQQFCYIRSSPGHF